MKELLITIAKALVDEPADVYVTEEVEEDGTVVLSLNVASSDKGKVIGKQGKIASAIRSVMKAASNKVNKKVIVKIV